MKRSLPAFRYHPDPIATGAIVESDETCLCCGEVGGFIYVLSFYAEKEIEAICPWCIESGRAAATFDGMFSDDWPLRQAGLSDDIVEEVTRRTPGFESWQQERWLAHCSDACAFLGDASKRDLQALSEGLGSMDDLQEWAREDYLRLLEYYEPKCSPAVYKFQCLHCKELIYGIDQC